MKKPRPPIIRNAIIRTAVKILFPVILVFGIYIASHGHLSPGGAFPAGVIIATGFILLIIAFKDEIKGHKLIDMKTIAGVMLVILVLDEYVLRHDVMATQTLFQLWSGGVTPIFNIVGGIMVFTALALIIYSMVKE